MLFPTIQLVKLASEVVGGLLSRSLLKPLGDPLRKSKNMAKFKDQMWQLAIHVSMTLLEVWILYYDGGGEPWLDEARRLYGQAGRAAADALGLPHPAGGTFLFFDASPWIGSEDSSLAFLERCVDAGVVLTPGGASGEGYETWVRLCFTCVSPDELSVALEKLAPLMPR